MSSTKLVPLGKGGPLVPRLGFGLMGLSYETYGAIPADEERFALLDRAYGLGERHWDSADLYGDSEELLGRWFKRTGKRDEIFLATKFGFVKGSKTFEINSTGKYAKEACAASLERLGIDCIDLYYLHHPNTATPIEETMRGLKELQDEGKIKHIGLSAVSSATLRRAVKIAPVAAVQADYSPFLLDIEGAAGTNLLATCSELGIAVVCTMPLGRGLLTSTFANSEDATPEGGRDVRPVSMPRFMPENRDTNVALVSQFQALAVAKGCTVAQLSLAWLLKQGEDIIPIPGTKKMKYLEENWAAQDVVLSDEDEKEIRSFLEKVEVAGGPLPPAFEGYNYRDTAEEVVA